MKLFKKLLLLVTGIMYSYSIHAQIDNVDAFLKNEMQKRNIPGLQLAVVKNGKIVKIGNYGLADLQNSIPVSENTVFIINSITKAFTGVATMQLVEAGKLNLSLPISTYLNDVPDAWKNVTTQQLLSHTSGIPDIVDEETNILVPESEEASWAKVQTLPMDFKPGEKFRYNQTNYLLLGLIIDKLSNMPFTEFIVKEQLQKVGMPHTIRAGFGGSRDVVLNSAGEYRFTRGKYTNMYFSLPPTLQAAGGMGATAKEIASWIIALQNKQLLKENKNLAALWTPAILNNGKTGGFDNLLNGYAAGWPTVERPLHPAVAPVGGGRSAVMVYPKDNLSIVVLTNLNGASPERFIDELAAFYIPDMKKLKENGFSPAVTVLRNTLEKSGYRNAIEEAKRANTSFDESELNNWGYALLKEKRIKDAIEIFKLNVFLFPKSANTYDSLGEMYAFMEEKDLAITNYEYSLKLDPKNKNAEEQLKKLKK
ncbi:serine hydrolase [Flavobacterium sp. GT3R68]|uniref:serine hydrolase n=1 Tax=Flavobacterium sp. GT3R68 TaxID=2594437 RepID=UPI000F85BFCF|nr:serine hydrolase [Flavobacterium sp. GT3R68]RTY92233.1 serine hydrolase [Flavobacterium sp. GSN2]TRW92469.1 serine hydrolase [Flavobacterium sp. GT3R68]